MKPSPRRLLPAGLAALLCFLALDACWLSLMGPRLYRPKLAALMADEVDWLAAGLFYAVYLTGLVVFAILPALERGGPRRALRLGALMGFVAYATYDLTNQATLRGWPWAVTAADLAWGAVVSGVAAWAGARVASHAHQ
ncbi:DUF2177 family protein [Paucibacter sp. R3-3]|uniref:DUF2177 family protein n=1 Tax=Roseateles agri TaxID=3098619 RepID=A0ABU5DIC7_9BURK|nr:DUF2177 family protein [Paucibacter sp. R3-3]MDY0746046.1 DUF2177 family protein [Paucibacter sp. R3-3]